MPCQVVYSMLPCAYGPSKPAHAGARPSPPVRGQVDPYPPILRWAPRERFRPECMAWAADLVRRSTRASLPGPGVRRDAGLSAKLGGPSSKFPCPCPSGTQVVRLDGLPPDGRSEDAYIADETGKPPSSYFSSFPPPWSVALFRALSSKTLTPQS